MTTTPSVSATNQSPLELLTRLQAWNLDSSGATLTFAGKLARDNGWSERHSARVIGEYLRFVVLAVTADHPVCPSDAVDRAWHQHLLDTHAYWDRFCPDLLGRPLHHRPSSGRPGERQQLGEWYRRTLESYRLTFGQAPPIDIWPPEDERFRRPVRFRLPRRWLAGLSWPMVVLLVVGLGGCQVVRLGLNSGAAQIWPFYPFTLSGPSFLTFYIQWMVVGWLFLKGLDFFLYLSPHSPPNDKSQPDLSPQEIAYLVGGPRNAVSTALLGLLHSGEVTIDGNTLE